MRWPWQKREERSAFPIVTHQHIEARRKGVAMDGSAALSATVATCAGVWSRAFSMLTPEPVADLLTPDKLSAIGLDLLMRGETCWHIRLERDELSLARVAYWDELGEGRYHLHIAHPAKTETVRAVEGEVLKLCINADAATPWKGRSPFALMGVSPALMAEIEGAVSGALSFVGKGVLPVPSTIAQEQQSKVLSGLQSGSLAVVTSKADYGHQTGGDRSELKRVELTPDLQRADLNASADSLHKRLLMAAGIPPVLASDSGNAGAFREAYRLFVLQTIEPLARQITPELRRKLGVERLSLDAMMSSDVAGRARAVGVLTGAGVPLAEAMRLVGWEGKGLTPTPKAEE